METKWIKTSPWFVFFAKFPFIPWDFLILISGERKMRHSILTNDHLGKLPRQTYLLPSLGSVLTENPRRKNKKTPNSFQKALYFSSRLPKSDFLTIWS